LQVSLLQPAHRPPSIMASRFAELLRAELRRVQTLF
jgi:hypothetical protein